MIRYGPAGWSYDDWAGEVYPQPAPKRFTHERGYGAVLEDFAVPAPPAARG